MRPEEHGDHNAGAERNARDEDAPLVGLIRSGNTSAYRKLVQKYERQVCGMGLGFFHNAEAAADFTQDVFLKAYLKLSQFEGKSRFSTWLYSIAWRTAVNLRERVKEYRSLADTEYESAYDTPEEASMKDVLRKAVREAVAGLPEKYRVCIDMYFFFDRSYQEIESITGYPVNTIKSHVFRAKKILKKRLSEYIEV